MTLTIAGAGMAGLLAAHMLAHHRPTMVELQSSLPNNHSAVLRFRSSVVAEATRIPFKRVEMIKTSVPWLNPVADALAYAQKNTGISRSDRSIREGLTVAERWIAPEDFILQLATFKEIKFSQPCDFTGEGPFISTLPMPALMKALDYPAIPPDGTFQCRPGINIHAQVQDCDAYVSLLVPDPTLPFYRVSLMGDRLIIEAVAGHPYGPEFCASQSAALLGIERRRISNITEHQARYAKILPVDEDLRRDFIFWATDKRNVFSLGRFSTWRPSVLLDDLVHDIRLIDGWLARAGRYAAARVR